jgi:hypothetical protein
MRAGAFNPKLMDNDSHITDKFCVQYSETASMVGDSGAYDQIVEFLGEYSKENRWQVEEVVQILATLTDTVWDRCGFPLTDDVATVNLKNNKRQREGFNDLQFLMVMSRPSENLDEGIIRYKRKGDNTLYRTDDDEQIAAPVTNAISEEEMVTDKTSAGGNSDMRSMQLEELLFLGAGGQSTTMNTDSPMPTQRRLPTRGLAIGSTSIVTDPSTNINEMDTDAIITSDQKVPSTPKPLRPARIPTSGYALFANNTFDRLKPIGDAEHFGRIPPDLALNLDLFVGSLRTGVLSLVANPTSKSSSDVAFASNDELAAWLCDAVGAKLIAANVDPKAIITSFHTSVSVANQLSLLFSSEKAVLLTTFNEADVKRNEKCSFDEPGLMEKATILCLGLKSFTGTTTLSQVTDFMGLKNLATTVPIRLLGLLKLQPYVGAGHRNAIWFDPVCNYDTAIRLQLEIAPDSKDLLKTLFQYLDPDTLGFSNTFVIGRKVCSYARGKEGVRILKRGDLTIASDISILETNFHGIIELSTSHIQLTLSVLQETTILETMISWIKNLLKTSDGNNEEFDESFSEWLNNNIGGATLKGLQPRSITLELGTVVNAQNQLQVNSINSFRLDIELNLNYGNSTNPAVFMATYTWRNSPNGSHHSLFADLMSKYRPPTH